MDLAKLTIHTEWGENKNILALFNPNKLVFTKNVQWEQKSAKERDVPELQFKHGQPRTLTLDLFFDTYDSESAQKTSVREYTDKLFKLTLVYADKHRPPVCKLSWGTSGVFFKCVLVSMNQQFILFMEDGTPVRAKCQCTFKEWRTNTEDQRKQKTESSDIVKKRIVKRGETLSSIAAEVYLNPGLWRPIAEMNAIDDPLAVVPGTELIIPTLSNRSTRET